MSSLRQATRPHKKPHLPGAAKTVAEHRLLRRLYGSATTWEVEGENGTLCALKLADEFWPETVPNAGHFAGDSAPAWSSSTRTSSRSSEVARASAVHTC